MRLLFIGFIFFFHAVHADTIKNYINIANNIPQMEIKADPQAQAWARSARQILNVTCESIQETILQIILRQQQAVIPSRQPSKSRPGMVHIGWMFQA